MSNYLWQKAYDIVIVHNVLRRNAVDAVKVTCAMEIKL